MMTPRFAAMMGVLGAAAGLTGCFSTTRLVQKVQVAPPESYKTASVEQLDQALADRDAAIKTLNAQVLITATTGGQRTGKVTDYTSFRGYIFVQKPANLRVLLQTPLLGSRALDMVSDGTTFTLMHATLSSGDVWMQGANKVTTPSKNGLENLRPPVFLDSLLVPGLSSEEYVTLTESTREVQPETKHHDAVEEPDYDLEVGKLKTGHILQRERVVHINRQSLLPFQQDIYDENGRITTQALYENYQPVTPAMGGTAGQQFPMLITIKRPMDEYSLKIEVTKLTLNETFDADQFKLDVPAGVVVKKME